MFDSHTEFASDLEWLLQSGHSDPARTRALISALTAEFSTEIWRLSLALWSDPDLALDAAAAAFATALSGVYRFRVETGVRPWFIPLALEGLERSRPRLERLRGSARHSSPAEPSLRTEKRFSELEYNLLQAVYDLPYRLRLVVLLRYLLDWSPAQIQAGLGISQGELDARLRQAWWEIDPASQDHIVDEELLRRTLYARWPATTLTPAQMASLNARIEEQAARVSAGSRRRVMFTETLLVAAVILVVAGLLFVTNRVFPEPASTPQPITRRTTTSVSAGQPPARSAAQLPAPQPTPRSTLPAARPSPTPMPQITPFPTDVFYEVMPGDTIASVARKLNTQPEELRRLNRIAPGDPLQAGALLLIPGKLTPQARQDNTLRAPSFTPAPLPDSASPEEILNRVRFFPNMHWHDLWLDYHVMLHGPSAYNGPGASHRLQAWLMNRSGPLGPLEILLVAGKMGQKPLEVALLNTEGFFLAQPGRGQPWFTPVEGFEYGAYVFSIFSQVTFPFNILDEAPETTHFEKAGEARIINRKVFILEQYDAQDRLTDRYWIDAHLGFPLAYQRLDPVTGKIEMETRALGFAANIDFPADIFDRRLPWRGGFALDQSGEPAPQNLLLETIPAREWAHLTHLDPAPAVDLSRAQLTFQMAFPPDLFQEGPLHAELFIDEKFAGRIPVPPPFFAYCARSPDGRYLALSDQGLPYRFPGTTSLIWVDLKEIHRTGQLEENRLASIFAFSPDSRKLAAYVVTPENRFAGEIVLIDLASREVKTLTTARNVSSLAWSPSGNNLAFLGARGTSSGEPNEILMTVIHIESGEIRFRDSVYISQGRPQFDPADEMLPMQSDIWEIEFPAGMNDLDACAAPSQP